MMIKFTFRLLACLFMCAAFSPSFAQQKSFSNVLSIQLRNMGAIYNKNQVTGYYMFYKVDRINSKTNSYSLRILDQNLNEVSENKIEESKNFYLLEAAYNDESLMFKFYDAKEKTISFYQYDNKSQLKNKHSRKAESRLELYVYSSQAEKEESDGTNLFAIAGEGFVDYGMKKDGKHGYAISFYPESKDGKAWTYESASNSKEVENAGFIAANKNLLISSIVRRNNLMSQNFESYLLGIDIHTGKKVFEKKVEDTQYELNFISANIEENTGNVALLGQYYKKNDNVLKDKSLGLCSYLMTAEGSIISKNYASWLTDVRKFLPVNAQGKIEDVGYLYFHKIVKNADGRYIAVGEQYRKAASAAGIAMTVLSGTSNGVTKMVIEDLVFLEFNPQFKLENVKLFDKSKTNVELPSGFDFAGPQVTALYLKSLGYFDYSYSQQNQEETTLSVGYVDYEKRKGEKNGLVFGAITYADKAYATDKLSLETEASTLRVIPAKPGYIMITEFFRKAKKLDMRLEKINY